MEKMFDAYYYDNNSCNMVETKEIFSDYQNCSHGYSTFPEYMEAKLEYSDFMTVYAYKETVIEEIEYCARNIENCIDDMRDALDRLEETIDCENEPELKWEMVEVLE